MGGLVSDGNNSLGITSTGGMQTIPGDPNDPAYSDNFEGTAFEDSSTPTVATTANSGTLLGQDRNKVVAAATVTNTLLFAFLLYLEVSE